MSAFFAFNQYAACMKLANILKVSCKPKTAKTLWTTKFSCEAIPINGISGGLLSC